MKKGTRYLNYILTAIIVLVIASVAMAKMNGAHENVKTKSLANTSAYEEALKAARGEQ